MARTRSEQYPDIKRNILKRAAAVFARVGYASATISDLADAAGLSRGALYHYFPSKEAILRDIFDQHLADFLDRVDQAMQASRVPVEQLRIVTQAIVELNTSCADEQVVILNDLNQLTAADHERMVALEKKILDRLSDLLMKVDNGGKITPGNKRVYTMMYLGVVNYTFAWYNPKGRVAPGEFADIASDVLLHGLLTKGGKSSSR